jgi:hypothetical protein
MLELRLDKRMLLIQGRLIIYRRGSHAPLHSHMKLSPWIEDPNTGLKFGVDIASGACSNKGLVGIVNGGLMSTNDCVFINTPISNESGAQYKGSNNVHMEEK